MTNLDAQLTLNMTRNDTQFKVWLDQYMKDTISSSDRELLMEAIADNRIDDMLNEEIKYQWVSGYLEAKSQYGPLAFERSAVFDLIRPISGSGKPSSASYRTMWWAAAAILLCIVGVLAVWAPWVKESHMLARIPTKYRKQPNRSEAIQEILLSDGSRVKLAKGATIYYPERFEGGMREVYLEGDGFFEVTHMEGVRFIVHGHSVSAEVLGTSFWMHQDKTLGNTEVEVRTGKVSVKANGYSEKDTKAAPVLVTANQKVAYRHEDRKLSLTLADTILPLHTPEVERILQDQHVLQFKKATRLGEVLSQLSKVYGVEIGLSSSDLNNCLVTGDLSGQDLIKSIEIICLSIGSTYERKQTRILISGSGCSLN